MRYFIYCRKSSEAEDRQVASIASQLTTLQRTFGGRPDIEVAGLYEEAFSAKAPGRAKFNEMLAQIEKGAAQGIIAWAPDRLARNSIDGGRLIYMIDCGVIKDLKFSTYTFENNSQGKFMLQIMFGQSKYYSDALSDNVKRGNRTKIENGWRPNQAPLGYKNDGATRTIVKDAVAFPLVRKMFDLMMTGSYTPKEIALTARDEWGFLTPKRKRSGGKPLAMSSVYKILSNPFYAGMIVWDGQIYPGKHEPVLSIDEFRQVRRMLDRPSRPRAKHRTFAFTGMIQCGACGLGITAEHKFNRYQQHYVYYHCSRPRLDKKCTEPSVELHDLERQILALLRSVSVDSRIERWISQEMAIDGEQLKLVVQARERSLRQASDNVKGQMNELTGLRLRNLLTDEEFVGRRQELQQEQIRLQHTLSNASGGPNLFEPFREVVLFSNRAADWFKNGNDREKRQILQTVCSNLYLKDKILKFEAKKPFASLAQTASIPHQLGVVDDVRTSRGTIAKLAKEISQYSKTEEGQHTFDCIRAVLNQDAEAMERLAPLRRYAKVGRGFGRARGDGGSFQLPRAA
ncbi:recombinase family protein [Bradyrhizobium sp. DASA03120]|uniref:recombinase family protein n=1 Tax=Bradyrhizobium sp. SMVTL-02 TaxID=3395917 RepID=UPI003F6FE271